VLDIDVENMSVRIQPAATFGKVYVEAEKVGLRNAVPSAPASVSMLANHLDKGVFQVSNKYGVGTDSILGLVIVLPDGEILRTGCLHQDNYGSICVEGPRVHGDDGDLHRDGRPVVPAAGARGDYARRVCRR
jgi:FAD/FMN-containing dehydrogenase